jgi:carbamoyl-phosphate synthase small subunit
MKAVLMLEDGTEFVGRGFGAPGLSFGEVIFSTSMTGYQELLTDPSYCGQILVCTAAHVGNVGINPEDHESGRAWLAGFVVQDAPRKYSNWRADLSLDSWLKQHGVVGLCDVDTRAVVKHLREKGAMRGAVCSGDIPSDLLRQILEHPNLVGRDMVSEVTCSGISRFGDGRLHVVAYDFGMKQHMMNLMDLHGLRITRVPASTTAAEVLSMKPDGVFLSNGPGDPAALQSVVEEIQGFLGRLPVFGICLGHQLLGRALGGETYKLKFGHHGSNHPVKDLSTGRVEITTQNHGFAVDPKTLGPDVQVTHVNLNDGTCEGIACPDRRVFSVQYHPENAPGPHDSRYLFERFVKNMEACCAQKN